VTNSSGSEKEAYLYTKIKKFKKTLDLPPYGSCIKQIQTAM